MGLLYPSEPDSTDAIIKIILECDPVRQQEKVKDEEEEK